MAKVKDSKVLTINGTQTTLDAKGKTAFNVNYADYDDITTEDGKTFLFKQGDSVITVNNAQKIKYIKTTAETDYTDLFSLGLIDYTGSISSKKSKFTGTKFNDTITGVGENDENFYGLGGNDVIDGGKGNDTITGGTGRNIILLTTKSKFGDDTVVLTKGEHLQFKLDVKESANNYVEKEIIGKDLKITVYSGHGYTDGTHNGTVQGTVTIKNYAKKDVLTSAGSLTLIDSEGKLLYDFRVDLTHETYMDSKEGHYNKSSFTGSWVDDGVYAENFKLYKNGKKISTDSSKGTEITTETVGYEKVKGVTINLGGATYYNEATGSIYADTIIGGANDDDIEGGKGNDNIKGGTGLTTVYYSKGDGHDTVTLTKGEKIDFQIYNIKFEDLKFVYSKNDLKLYYEEDGVEAGSITLKNFGAKDVTNNSTKKNPVDSSFVTISFYNNEQDYKSYELRKDIFIKTEVNKSNFTGKWLRDYIDASNSDELLKRGKHVNMVLNGGKGDDKIVGSRYADTLKGGDGDDVITGGRGDDLIYGEAGKNTLVFNSGDGVDTVYSGKGEDTLKFEGSDNTLALMQFERGRNSKGKQTSDLIIHYGMDRDSYITVKNYYDKNGDPSDKCSVKKIQIGENKPIDIETAREQAKQAVESGEAVFGGGQITAKAQTKFVVGSNNADAIDLAPSAQNEVSVYAGEGNNTVTGKTGTNVNYNITSGSGDDTITTGNGVDVINAGDGVNIIETGSGQKTITVGNSTVTDPEDDNYNLGSTITLGYSNANSEITTGTGDDTININHNSSSEGIKITSTGGDNKINIDDEGVFSMTVETGDGDDNLTSTGQIGKYSASYATEIDLGNGDNTVSITNSGIYDTTIETGDGNDKIYLDGWGDSNKITSTGGNNEITYASKITGWNSQAGAEITTGDGDDTITIGGFEKEEEEEKAVGSVGGNIIKAGGGNNEISIAYGNENTITTGSGNDKIYIANKSESNSAYDNNIDAGDGNNEIELKSGDNNTIKTGSGNDKITVYQRGDNNTITSTGGDNEIYYGKGMSGQGGTENSNQSITTGAGNDKIYIGNVVDGAHGGVNYITINAGDGDNELYMGYDSAHGNIKTGSGNDKIYYNQGDENNFSYENTIDAGEGKNEIYITKGYKYNITTGSGDDIITKGTSGGRMDESSKTTISAGDGHNVITLKDGAYDITTGDSTVTDKSAKNYNIGSEINITSDSNIHYLNIKTGSGDDTITMNRGGDYGSSITIDAGDGDNHIEYANNKGTSFIGNGATITTGSGDDTIIVGMFDKEGIGTDSPEVNVINAGDGDNEITIACGQENEITTTGDGTNTISINGNSYLNTITTGDGNDTIELGKNTTAYNQYNTITAGNGTNTITIGNEDSQGNNYNEIITGSGNDTITLGKHSGNNTITTGDGVDSITLGTYSDNNTITTGNGKKTITTGDNSAGNEITTGSGDDVITLGAGSGNIVNTGDGADTVTMYSATLNTGSGNDTVYLKGSASGTELTMGTGDDTLDVSEVTAACDYNIHFNTGDGKDTVEGITYNGRYFFNITSDYLVVKRRSTVEGHTNDLELVMYDKTGTEVTDDLITIENYYGEGDVPVNTQIYVNGTNINYIPEGIITGEGEINGTNNSDYIFGSDSDDIIKPKEGKDFISSGKGNDIIDFEDNNDKKYVYYNKGDGDLTLKNISTTSSSENSGIHLYMEDIEAETTVYERHGCDMHIIRDLGNDETEKVVLEDVFPDIDDTGIVENVYLYTEDGKYLGLIYSYPEIMHIYPDEATGILTGDAYVKQNIYHTDSTSNKIIIPGVYSNVANYIYGGPEGNVITVDMAWCFSEGYCLWENDDSGNLIITAPIDCSLPYEERYADDNTVTITIDNFYNEYNTVNTFKFDAYTRDYNEIEPLWNTIDKSEEETSQLIKGTWRRDVITGSSVGLDTIYANGGDDEITAISAQTIEGGDGKDKITLTGSTDGAYVYGDTLGWRNIEQGANDKIYGGSGNDNLFGCGGNDEIHGGAGEDYIEGGYGDDNLYGGKGNDSLYGIEGNNTYHFFTGDGTDEVHTTHGGETIKFEDIDFNDITYARGTYNNLELSYGSGDKVKIISHNNYDDDNVTVVDQNKDTKTIFFSEYTNSGDMMYGTDGDDIFLGTSWGSTKITAGEGNDIINITEDNQSYHNYYFNTGDGHDTIIDHSAKTTSSYLHMNDSDLEDTNFVKSGSDLIIKYNYDEGKGDYADSVTLNEFFGGGNSANKIYYQGDEIARDIISENGNIHKETVTENFTGSTLNDYITIGADDITVAGGDGYNTYVVNNNTTATITSTNANDKIVMNGWGLGAYTLTGDGADVILENEDKTVSLRFTNGAAFGNKNIGFYGPSGALLSNLSDMLTANNFYAFNTGGAHDGTNNNDYIWASGNASGLNGYGGSDTIYSDAYIEIATYTDRDTKDTTEGVVNKVYLSGDSRHTVHASGETNIISSSGNSRDIYQAYIDQITSITDAGGDDSFTLKNTGSSDDGYYKISGELNTHLFFKVDAGFDKTKDTFDVNIGKGYDMENAAQGNDHVGIFIKDNQVENISTGDGYSITSAQLATIAESAAGWIADKGYATYDKMLSEGGSDLAKQYVSYINTQAQDYWQAPTP